MEGNMKKDKKSDLIATWSDREGEREAWEAVEKELEEEEVEREVKVR